MPTTMNCMINKLKYNERIAKFVISLGVVLQFSGSITFLSVAAVFVARSNGQELQWDSLVTLVIVISITATTMPHMPSGSLILLVVILTTINVDPSNVSLLFAVDWIL